MNRTKKKFLKDKILKKRKKNHNEMRYHVKTGLYDNQLKKKKINISSDRTAYGGRMIIDY